MPDATPSERYPHILKAVFERPWAIRPEMLGVMADLVRFRAEGGVLADDEIRERIAAQTNGPRRGGGNAGAVRVIPIYGVLSQRMNLMSEMSGGTSVESLKGQLRDALADSDISAIVFDIDSPGGAVDGIDELATEIREARGAKKMVAVADTMAASAAYWIAAAMDEIVVTPSGSVGSIGIFAVHQEFSRMDDAAGVTTTLVSAGKFKTEGNEFEPLSDEARDHLQDEVDTFYDMFLGSVAKSRGVSATTVRGQYGEGRLLLAKAAKAAGMVDRIDTLENTIARVSGASRQPSRAAMAEIPYDEMVALALGRSYSDRLSLASALAADIARSTDERIALRTEEGRVLSADSRQQLLALSEHLREIAGPAHEPDDGEHEPPADPTQPPAATAAKRIGLAVYEAALSGGYRLPSEEVTPS